MLPHITLENILLSYGSDKNAIIWDMKIGAKQRVISMVNIDHINQFSWFRSSASSPISFCFCATNSNGELIIYNDSNETVSNNVIYEQFFESDFDEIVWDETNNLRDLTSGLERHLIPYGKLVNSKKIAYNLLTSKFDMSYVESLNNVKSIIKPLSDLVVRFENFF